MPRNALQDRVGRTTLDDQEADREAVVTIWLVLPMLAFAFGYGYLAGRRGE